MTGLRVLQAMAGAPHGGAEAFFTRLVIALHRAGLAQRVVIRRDRARAGKLRAAGLDPVELGFGGRLDLATPLRLAAEIRRFRPHVALTWMSRATALMPPRALAQRYVHAARLGGYYDLKYYRRCDHLVGNTHAIVDHALAAALAAGGRASYESRFTEAAVVRDYLQFFERIA